MDVHRLRYFVAVAETGGFTRAAAREGITQPSLSQQVIELEKELNARLFDRLGRKVVLTAAGEQLLPHARAVLAAVAAAERAVAAGDGEYRVGAIPTVAPYLLPAAVARFARDRPSALLKVLEDRTERLLEAVVGGDADVAVMAIPVADHRLHVEKLFTEPLLLAVPAGHRLAGKKLARLADVVDEPFLLLDDVHCFGDQVLSLCRRAGAFEPRVVCTGEQLGTLLGLVATGLGVSVVPRMAAAGSAEVVYLPFADPAPSRTICAVWHKQRYRPAGVRAFVGLLTDPAAVTRGGRTAGGT